MWLRCEVRVIKNDVVFISGALFVFSARPHRVSCRTLTRNTEKNLHGLISLALTFCYTNVCALLFSSRDFPRIPSSFFRFCQRQCLWFLSLSLSLSLSLNTHTHTHMHRSSVIIIPIHFSFSDFSSSALYKSWPEQAGGLSAHKLHFICIHLFAGLSSEGIYRVSGIGSAVREIQEMFDKGNCTRQ